MSSSVVCEKVSMLIDIVWHYGWICEITFFRVCWKLLSLHVTCTHTYTRTHTSQLPLRVIPSSQVRGPPPVKCHGSLTAQEAAGHQPPQRHLCSSYCSGARPLFLPVSTPASRARGSAKKAFSMISTQRLWEDKCHSQHVVFLPPCKVSSERLLISAKAYQVNEESEKTALNRAPVSANCQLCLRCSRAETWSCSAEKRKVTRPLR